MKKITFAVIFSLIIFGFGFTNSALAIGTQPIDITSLGDEVGVSLMASSDLGVDNVGTLPTSNFYFFKEWGRGFSRFFTFNATAKAELELKITNEKAAEALAVEKANPDDAEALTKALQNYTKAQERLNTRLLKLKDNSENPKVAELLKKVDEKTAKHAELLEQLVGKIATGTIVNDDTDVSKILDNARNNIEKTFTISVEKENDVKQRATDQIKRAEDTIRETTNAMQEVSTTRGMWLPSTGDTGQPGISDQGAAGGLDSYLAFSRDRLKDAKTAFEAGKFGEAYGLARSAEVTARNGLRKIDVFTIKQKTTKVENESPRSTDIGGTFGGDVQLKSAAPKPKPRPTGGSLGGDVQGVAPKPTTTDPNAETSSGATQSTPQSEEPKQTKLESTTTSLTSSANSSNSGQSVTFTATIKAGATPTGSVVFLLNDVTNLGSSELNERGTATLTTSTLSVGTHTVTATYVGDKAHSGSASPSIKQVVNSVSPSPTTESGSGAMGPGSSAGVGSQ